MEGGGGGGGEVCVGVRWRYKTYFLSVSETSGWNVRKVILQILYLPTTKKASRKAVTQTCKHKHTSTTQLQDVTVRLTGLRKASQQPFSFPPSSAVAQGARDPAEAGGEGGVGGGDQGDLQLPAAGGGRQDQEAEEGQSDSPGGLGRVGQCWKGCFVLVDGFCAGRRCPHAGECGAAGAAVACVCGVVVVEDKFRSPLPWWSCISAESSCLQSHWGISTQAVSTCRWAWCGCSVCVCVWERERVCEREREFV